jgi:hypothetical protein
MLKAGITTHLPGILGLALWIEVSSVGLLCEFSSSNIILRNPIYLFDAQNLF